MQLIFSKAKRFGQPKNLLGGTQWFLNVSLVCPFISIKDFLDSLTHYLESQHFFRLYIKMSCYISFNWGPFDPKLIGSHPAVSVHMLVLRISIPQVAKKNFLLKCVYQLIRISQIHRLIMNSHFFVLRLLFSLFFPRQYSFVFCVFMRFKLNLFLCLFCCIMSVRQSTTT